MAEKIDFEKQIKRLEEIVSVLEKGEISLDEMIDLYSEGTKIVNSCSQSLEEARVKITKISRESEEDNE